MLQVWDLSIIPVRVYEGRLSANCKYCTICAPDFSMNCPCGVLAAHCRWWRLTSAAFHCWLWLSLWWLRRGPSTCQDRKSTASCMSCSGHAWCRITASITSSWSTIYWSVSSRCFRHRCASELVESRFGRKLPALCSRFVQALAIWLRCFSPLFWVHFIFVGLSLSIAAVVSCECLASFHHEHLVGLSLRFQITQCHKKDAWRRYWLRHTESVSTWWSWVIWPAARSVPGRVESSLRPTLSLCSHCILTVSSLYVTMLGSWWPQMCYMMPTRPDQDDSCPHEWFTNLGWS